MSNKGLEQFLGRLRQRPEPKLVSRFLALVADLDDEREKGRRVLELSAILLPSKPKEALRLAHMVFQADRSNLKALELVADALEKMERLGKAEVIRHEIQRLKTYHKEARLPSETSSGRLAIERLSVTGGRDSELSFELRDDDDPLRADDQTYHPASPSGFIPPTPPRDAKRRDRQGSATIAVPPSSQFGRQELTEVTLPEVKASELTRLEPVEPSPFKKEATGEKSKTSSFVELRPKDQGEPSTKEQAGKQADSSKSDASAPGSPRLKLFGDSLPKPIPLRPVKPPPKNKRQGPFDNSAGTGATSISRIVPKIAVRKKKGDHTGTSYPFTGVGPLPPSEEAFQESQAKASNIDTADHRASKDGASLSSRDRGRGDEPSEPQLDIAATLFDYYWQQGFLDEARHLFNQINPAERSSRAWESRRLMIEALETRLGDLQGSRAPLLDAVKGVMLTPVQLPPPPGEIRRLRGKPMSFEDFYEGLRKGLSKVKLEKAKAEREPVAELSPDVLVSIARKLDETSDLSTRQSALCLLQLLLGKSLAAARFLKATEIATQSHAMFALYIDSLLQARLPRNALAECHWLLENTKDLKVARLVYKRVREVWRQIDSPLMQASWREEDGVNALLTLMATRPLPRPSKLFI